MSRMPLDDEILAEIGQRLPDLKFIQEVAGNFAPDFISSTVDLSYESLIPIASVCLKDTSQTLTEARYALHEYFAHDIWYRQKQKPPAEYAAIFFGRYYLDDTALRLYSAGEHLANAIIFMMELEYEHLSPYRKRTTSQQSIVGRFLMKEMADHPLTNILSTLSETPEWQETSKYRNLWVHEQPPTVDGMGRVYERRIRWEKTEKEHELSVGGGDTPQYSVNDILNFVKPALFQFKDTLSEVLQFYSEILKKHAIGGTDKED